MNNIASLGNNAVYQPKPDGAHFALYYTLMALCSLPVGWEQVVLYLYMQNTCNMDNRYKNV